MISICCYNKLVGTNELQYFMLFQKLNDRIEMRFYGIFEFKENL